MDNETKKCLDKLVAKFQSFICVEYAKVGGPNEEEVKKYLFPIATINHEFKTNYSLTPKKYIFNKLPITD